MEQETKMMCPFRRKENGDFEPCYGKACMAYFEWPTIFPPGSADNFSCPACKLLLIDCGHTYSGFGNT